MKIIYDIGYLWDLKESILSLMGLPDQIITESNHIPKKGDAISFDNRYPLIVNEVRFVYYTKNKKMVLDSVYVFLKLKY